MKIAILAAATAALVVAGQRHARQIYHSARAAVSSSTPSAAGATPIDPKTVPPTVVGMNLGGLADYSSEEIFYEPLKTHGILSIQNPELAAAEAAHQDADGWLHDMPKDARIVSQVGLPLVLSKPLSCTVSPGWRVDGGTSAIGVQTGTRFTLSLKPGPQDATALVILTALHDHADLTELSCRPQNMPAGAVFRPDFLRDIAPFRILRFMDWMKANEEPAGSWDKRPRPQRYSPVRSGMPVETMVALANVNHSDPWFTLPFHADADYQRRFATYVRDHLDPGLKAYAELSNEIWNSGFPQSREATTLGKLRYPSADEGQANDYYYGDRVRAMMAIWSEVFAGQRQRLVRVLSDQAAWAQRADQALGHEKTWRSVDVLAIAPYFGTVPNDVPGKGQRRVDGIVAKIPAQIDEAMNWGRTNKLIANKYGLRLITYEGGPSINAFEPEMVRDARAANHDPRMYALYMGFLQRWRKEIGGELVLFDSVNDGFWGHLDRTGQPLSEAPKMRAVVDFIGQLPKPGAAH